MKRVIGAALVAVGLAASPVMAKDYVILARGQGPGSANLGDAVAAAGGTLTARLDAIGVVLARSEASDFAARIAADARIERVAEDMMVQWISPKEQAREATEQDLTEAGVNSEPYSGYQWNIRQIHADVTAADGNMGKGARVAVLDAGMAIHHPDLAENVDTADMRSFVPGEGVEPVGTGFNHGTHVGGIIAAAINGRGIQGVAPQATLIPIKVLRESGSGSFSWLIQGLMYAADLQVDVANMSLGATFNRTNAGGDGLGSLVAALNRAIDHATQAGVLCVSAAGNEAVDLNSNIWSIPAQSGNGMAVSATGPYNQQDIERLASDSNYGQSVVNVAAPGGEYIAGNVRDYVLAPGSRTGGYYFAVGTSMAAPHVSGIAALIVGRYGRTAPAQLRARIEQSAIDILKPGADAQTGKGRADAAAALQ